MNWRTLEELFDKVLNMLMYLKFRRGKRERVEVKRQMIRMRGFSNPGEKCEVLQTLSYCIDDERATLACRIQSHSAQKSSSFEPQIIAGQMCTTAMSHFVQGTATFRPVPPVVLAPFDSSSRATDVFVFLVSSGTRHFTSSWLARIPHGGISDTMV